MRRSRKGDISEYYFRENFIHLNGCVRWIHVSTTAVEIITGMRRSDASPNVRLTVNSSYKEASRRASLLSRNWR